MAAESKVRGNNAGIRQVSWRLGAALAVLVGLGMPAANQAEESQHQVLTALSSTVLSGYVDSSALGRIPYYPEPIAPLLSKSDTGGFFTGDDISRESMFDGDSGQLDFIGASSAALEQVPEPSSMALGTLAFALYAGWKARCHRKNG